MPKITRSKAFNDLLETIKKANEAVDEKVGEGQGYGTSGRIKTAQEAGEQQEKLNEQLEKIREALPEYAPSDTAAPNQRGAYQNPSIVSDDRDDLDDDDIHDDEIDPDTGDAVDYEDDYYTGLVQQPSARPDLPSRLSRIHEHLADVRKETMESTLRTWFQTDGRWDATALAGITAVVGAGQITSVALQSAWLETAAKINGYKTVPDKTITERPGVDKDREYSRPFNEVEYQLGQGADQEYAMRKGAQRLMSLVATDLQLAKTKTARDMLGHSSVQRYQRVIGSSNPCALCLLASTQVYYKADLMPIHPGCECDVAPLDGDDDPRDIWIPAQYLAGPKSEVEDDGTIDRPDAPKSSTGTATRASDIRRYLQSIANEYDKNHPKPEGDIPTLGSLIQTRDHGEMGPMLTYTGQKFTGPNDLPQKPSRILPAQGDYDLAALQAAGGKPSPLFGISQDEIAKRVAAAKEERTTKQQNAFKYVQLHGTEHATISQYQDYLVAKHAGLNNVEGFDYTTKRNGGSINETAAREALDTVDQIMSKHPNVPIGNINTIDFDPDDQNVIALTTPGTQPGSTYSISLNRRYMTNDGAQMMRDQTKRSEELGFYFPGASENPWQNAILHEYGHAMDNRGGLRARQTVNKDSVDLFKRTHPDQDVNMENYTAWELGPPPQVSGYSMLDQNLPEVGVETRRPILNNSEAIAQAFADVETRGAGASDLSKLLYHRVVQEAAKPLPDETDWKDALSKGLETKENIGTAKLVESSQEAAKRAMKLINVEAAKRANEAVGQPVTIHYQRNNAGVRSAATAHQYGQDDEPYGRYLSEDSGRELPAGWERGTVTFAKPLYVDSTEGTAAWKAALSKQYGGATGKALSAKLKEDGYDGVIARDEYGISEIVDLKERR